MDMRNFTSGSKFNTKLTCALKKFYRGRLPSFSIISRDFALRSPHLKHISGETIRKWVRGESSPHYSRIQVLEKWLGVSFNEEANHFTAQTNDINKSENITDEYRQPQSSRTQIIIENSETNIIPDFNKDFYKLLLQVLSMPREHRDKLIKTVTSIDSIDCIDPTIPTDPKNSSHT